jgi:hypothetical protein
MGARSCDDEHLALFEDLLEVSVGGFGSITRFLGERRRAYYINAITLLLFKISAAQPQAAVVPAPSWPGTNGNEGLTGQTPSAAWSSV